MIPCRMLHGGSVRDAEIQFENWDDKMCTFMQWIAEEKRTNTDIRGLIGGIILDWRLETRDICLSTLRNLPINRWISQAERRLSHPYRQKPLELLCFEYKNFAFTARQLRELCTELDMFDAIPEQHYPQFLNDISYRLMEKVCDLAFHFLSPAPSTCTRRSEWSFWSI